MEDGAGIVEQDVQRLVAQLELEGGAADVGQACQIALQRLHAFERGQLRRIAAEGDDARAHSPQLARRHLADARSRAGDEDDLALHLRLARSISRFASRSAMLSRLS